MLFFSILAIAALTILTAVKLDTAMIVVVPTTAILLAVYFKRPEIGLASVLVGQNLYGIAIAAVGVEKPILAYAPYGLISLASIALLLLRKKIAIPKHLNIALISVAYLTLLFVFNYHRTDFADNTTVKTTTFFVAALIPMLCFSVLKIDESVFKLIFKAAVILGVIPVLYSALTAAAAGNISGFGRFNAIELVNVNQYARNIGYISVFALWWIFETKNRPLKLALAFFIALSFAIIIMTGSRTSLLSTMGAIFMYIALFTNLNPKKRIALIGAVSGAVGIPMFLGFGSMLRRFSSLKYVDMSLAGRVGMWKAAWEHRWDSVLIGHGTGNFASILPAWAVAGGLRHPHNLIMEYYFEWGILGLIALVSIFVSPIVLWYRIRKTSPRSEMTALSNFVLVLVAFSLVNGMIDSSAVDPQLYATLGLMTAIYINSQRGTSECV